MSKKILVVDDDHNILEAIALILEDSGYTVETISKGEQTFQKINQYHPDLILLDVLMSGVDGRDICKQLKNNSETKNIPLIMISAHPSAKKGALDCGAENFIAKPFEIDELISLIDKYTS